MNASAELTIFKKKVRVEVPVPEEPTRPLRMLPVLQTLADSLVGAVVEVAEAEGLEISCVKGCGACCRQMVPISTTEARRLRELVDSMPDPRRTEILTRFSSARERLDGAGMLARLVNSDQVSDEEFRPLGLEYFHQGIACPFLEEESCSIHQDRPIVCREYLVVSPAENCARQNGQPIRNLSIPAQVSKAIQHLSGDGETHWVPLVLALDWADTHPAQQPLREGKELVLELFNHLTGRDVENL